MDALAKLGFSGIMTTTANTSVHPTVAAFGGTGHTGSRVAERLRARGLDVRISEHFLHGTVLDGVVAVPAGTVPSPSSSWMAS